MQRSHRNFAAVAAILALGSLLGSTAATAAQPDQPAQTVKPGQEQGLGLKGAEVPQLLQDAKADPYALPPRVDCASLGQRVAELDNVLGPDLDAPQMVAAEKDRTDDLMAGVRAVVPYGGVVRQLTGAAKRDQALVNAALAGWERRGYLKGLAHSRGCRVGASATPAAAVVQTAAPAAPVAAAPPAKKKKKKSSS